MRRAARRARRGTRKFTIRSQVAFSFDGEPALDVRTMQPAPGWGGARRGTGEDEPLIRQFNRRCTIAAMRAHGGPAAASQHAPAVDAAFAERLRLRTPARILGKAGPFTRSARMDRLLCARATANDRRAGAFISDGVPERRASRTTVSIRVPHDTFDAQPGYYHVFGETLDELADHLILTRLYFHCGAEERGFAGRRIDRGAQTV